MIYNLFYFLWSDGRRNLLLQLDTVHLWKKQRCWLKNLSEKYSPSIWLFHQ